ncbi:hypothetical protein CCACVL1_28739 [Corchorus capsularis]|uniref:Uncharacterized protein n=1 Tax=Corchorus capsularis TaxID=210143 RepID=A0A1R3G5D6_COCAP|nr:hypothetical protein CCACVL1_28739 [Corchorus capsularis]
MGDVGVLFADFDSKSAIEGRI